MQVSFKTQDLNYSQDISDLLCQIDVWLSKQAKAKLIGDRFGADVCVDMDAFDVLSTYREILYSKAKGYPCYKHFLIDDIISRIKQLLNKN